MNRRLTSIAAVTLLFAVACGRNAEQTAPSDSPRSVAEPGTEAPSRIAVSSLKPLSAVSNGWLLADTPGDSIADATGIVSGLFTAANVHVRVFNHDGSPVSNAYARLYSCATNTTASPRSAWPGDSIDLINGECVFSNVPVDRMPLEVVCAEFLSPAVWRALVQSCSSDWEGLHRPITHGSIDSLQPGMTTNIDLVATPYGRIIFRFSEPVEADDVLRNMYVYGTSMPDDCRETGEDRRCADKIRSWNLEPEGTDWVLPASPGTYLLQIYGTYVVEVLTNLVVTSNADTVLDIISGTTRVSSITVVLDDGSLCEKKYLAKAFSPDSTNRVAIASGSTSNVFSFGALDRSKRYDVCVRLQVDDILTNITVSRVQPGEEPIDIALPRSFTVRGVVVDERGNPLPCRAGIISTKTFEDGQFVCGPVRNGPCSLLVTAEGYAPLVKMLDGGPRDIDLGTVVMSRGRTIRGRVVYEDGSAATNMSVNAKVPTESCESVLNGCVALSRTDEDGWFVLKHAPSDLNIVLLVDSTYSLAAVVASASDCDVGALVLRRTQWTHTVVKLVAPDGRPVRNAEIIFEWCSFLRESVDEPGVYVGECANFGMGFDRISIRPHSTQNFWDDLDTDYRSTVLPYPLSTEPTNHVTIRMPEDAWRRWSSPQ